MYLSVWMHLNFGTLYHIETIYIWWLITVGMYGLCYWWQLLLFLSQILERGFHPEGTGKVTFTCPVLKKMPPIVLEDCGRIKRIRGIVYPYSY